MNKQELLLQLKDFLGDVNLPDDQPIKPVDPEDFHALITDALAHEGLENEINFGEVAEPSGYYRQVTYYSQAINKTIVLDTLDYMPDTIEELANYIIERNNEAQELEAKLLKLNE
jgi:hypothetical protein